MTTPVSAPPSLDEMRALYEAAIRFQTMACWDWMSEDDLFAIRNPETGAVGYCCVMGGAEEFYALAVYQGSEGLAVHMQMKAGQLPENPAEILMMQNCLMASFEDREQVQKEDREIMKQLGLKFRGRNAWPLFRSYRPGYLPWFVNGEEARFLTMALQQTMEVAARLKENPKLLPPSRGQFFARVAERNGDGWTWHDARLAPDPLPEKTLPDVPLDEARLSKIAEAAERTSGVLEMDFTTAPAPLKEESDERPYFPYLILAADHDSGMILDFDLTPPQELASRFVEKLISLLERMGQLPEEIQVSREEAFALLEPVTSRLEIRLRAVESLEGLEAAQEELSQFMGL